MDTQEGKCTHKTTQGVSMNWRILEGKPNGIARFSHSEALFPRERNPVGKYTCLLSLKSDERTASISPEKLSQSQEQMLKVE